MANKIDYLLDPDNMPGNKNWMNISPDVAKQLTKEELYQLILHTVLMGGQKEHDMFYNSLERICGVERTCELIDNAKKKK
jgi:hypothetical protein